MDLRPECFGKHWSSNHVMCTGGLDPAYVGENSEHIRGSCSYYTECGSPLISAQQLVRNQVETTPPAPSQFVLAAQESKNQLNNVIGLKNAAEQESAKMSQGFNQHAFLQQQMQNQLNTPKPTIQLQLPQVQQQQQQPQVQPPQQNTQLVQQQNLAYQQQIQQLQQQVQQLQASQMHQSAVQQQTFVPAHFVQPGTAVPSYLATPEPMAGHTWWSALGHTLTRSAVKAIGVAIANWFDHVPLKSRHVRAD
jgi:hypothetical protein